MSNLTTLGLVLAAGGLAGALGGLLGLGGGVFLVPFLNLALGLGFKQAVAVSLMTVIATSSVVSARTAGRQLINLRLGMVLEVATAAGGLAGGVTAQLLADRLLQALFALATAAIAVVMLRRLDLPAAREVEGLDVGRLGGRYIDESSGREIRYRVRRVPVALGVSFVAGNVSSLLGIGGGVLKVPALNAWCGVPMRAAAATSA
ncbi:MAG TPA: sulfite exporter TauE/SafE family protein, partial [Vicinamibacterales bacterium]|nr:sulfite exporter TauE/SafE family protein [Vicinamibacterales bacterium]